MSSPNWTVHQRTRAAYYVEAQGERTLIHEQAEVITVRDGSGEIVATLAPHPQGYKRAVVLAAAIDVLEALNWAAHLIE